MTHMGIAVFWPLSPRMVRMPRGLRWRSGFGLIEWPVAALAMWVAWWVVTNGQFV
jgi:hypothetical protein